MTTTNRRHLARVRNAFLGATALAGFAVAASPASAIVINANYTPTQVIDTTNVTGVGQMVIDLQNGFIGLCTVSLINPRTVIFASHCVNENPAGNGFEPGTGYGKANGGLPIGFFFNVNNNVGGNSAIGHWLNGVGGGPKDLTRVADNAYNSNFVVYDKNCCTIGLGNNFLQADIAMAALDTPAVGIPTWTLLFSPLSAPVHATITGYGNNGVGANGGNGGIDFKRRVAENVLSVLGSLDDQDTFLFGAPDGLPANLYMLDFNDPKFGTAQANLFDFNIFHDAAYTKEGITAPGDSGGPLIVDHAFTTPTIAAVLSGGDRFYSAQKSSSYGTTSFYQPLYLYWDWILANNPYKYVTSTAGNHNWTDANAFVMALDPAYMTINGNSTTLVNGLPSTPAQGIADVAPGFGTVCYFDICVNIKTGVITNPTPAPGPNPTGGITPAPDGVTGAESDMAVVSAGSVEGSGGSAQAPQGARPFGGALGVQGFIALAQSLAASNGGCANGPAIISVADFNAGVQVSADAATCTPSAGGGGGSSNPALSPQSDWTNPEGTALAGGVQVQGAPGASVGQTVNNKDANTGAATPARYYDVTFAAAGTTTLDATTITVDKVTVNGASAALTIGSTGVLNTLISMNSFAGTTTVNGTLNAAGGVNMFGGVLQGTGTVNGPTGFLIGAVAPGTVGTVGTLTINGALGLGIGSTTVIDFSRTTTDLLAVNGSVALSGTALFSQLDGGQQGDSHIFMTATGGITGSYAAVPDTIAGVLLPVVTKQTVGGVDREIVTLQAGSFVSLLAGTGTPDQTTIAAALDAVRAGNYNALLPLYQAIDPLSGAALGQALENIAPDAERTGTLIGDMTTGAFDGMLWSHLGEVGGGSHGGQAFNVDADGLKMALNSATGTSQPAQELRAIGQSIATNPGGGNDAIPTGAPAAVSPAEGGGMMLPAGSGGFLTGSAIDGSVAVGGGGGRADVRGIVIAGGIDTPLGDGFTLGGSFGYSDATANLRAAPAMVQSNSLQGAIYGRYDFGTNWIAEAFASYGHQTIHTTRIVVVGLTSFTLQGHTGGDSPSAGIYIGRSFGVDTLSGETLHLIPSLSLQYTSSGVDGFTETGGAPAMTFAGFSSVSTSSRLGLDMNMTFDVFNIKLTPTVGAFWVDNFEGNNGTITAGFAAAPSAIMTFATSARDRSYGQFNLGADIDLGDFLGTQATLSGRYDANTRSDVSAEAWTGRLSIKF